jgi:transposase
MGRRKFTPEFRLEAAKLVSERGVPTTQAANDPGMQVNVPRKQVKSATLDAGVPESGGGTKTPRTQLRSVSRKAGQTQV